MLKHGSFQKAAGITFQSRLIALLCLFCILVGSICVFTNKAYARYVLHDSMTIIVTIPSAGS